MRSGLVGELVKETVGCTFTWVMGLEELLSFFRDDGEMGPLVLRGCGRGGILAPGDTCMLASWAAYSCCREVEKPARRSHPNPAYIQSFIFSLFLSLSASVSAFIPPPHFSFFYVFPPFPWGWHWTLFKGLNCISKAEPRERQQS